jgi:hypothetical protein
MININNYLAIVRTMIQQLYDSCLPRVESSTHIYVTATVEQMFPCVWIIGPCEQRDFILI